MSPAVLWLQVLILVLFIIGAAFFAASEAALVSLSRARARGMLDRGLRRANAVVKLQEHRNRSLTTILVGNTIVLLAADSLATYLFIRSGLPSAAVLSTVLMTIVFLLFGEIIPKTIAVSDSDRWALRLAPAMLIVCRLLSPVVQTFLFLTDLVLRPFGMPHSRQIFVTEEDIRALVNVGAEQKVLEEQERQMIHSVIEFGDTIVREVMTHRQDIVAVEIDDSPRRALDLVIAEGYSKLPVYEESKDDIVGVVHDRELLISLANGTLSSTPLRQLLRPLTHVPENKKIAELLREMQRDKFSMAIVVDEYGGTAGLVTMEDLLEEIVGEIRDEHDEGEEEPIRVVKRNEAVVDAAVNIEDVNAQLGTQLPHEEFETIGGYTVGRFGRLPHEGEEIASEDGSARIKVDRTRGKRIMTVRIYCNGVPTLTPEAAEARESSGQAH
ncbi:MAG: HlyC/CorC family transporter [Candidatus Eremiobacteraeota bacterium]|nr:HlyC/CorC family transporter [Candidatus Eremiobacteraeota bacterium]